MFGNWAVLFLLLLFLILKGCFFSYFWINFIKFGKFWIKNTVFFFKICKNSFDFKLVPNLVRLGYVGDNAVVLNNGFINFF